MPGAVGRIAQVLSPRGGIKLGQIQTPGFYWAGFLSMILAVLKLTIEGHWSWWRVLLPVWVGNRTGDRLGGPPIPRPSFHRR